MCTLPPSSSACKLCLLMCTSSFRHSQHCGQHACHLYRARLFLWIIFYLVTGWRHEIWLHLNLNCSGHIYPPPISLFGGNITVRTINKCMNRISIEKSLKRETFNYSPFNHETCLYIREPRKSIPGAEVSRPNGKETCVCV